MLDINIEEVWKLLKKYEGEEFYTVSRNLPFVYKFVSDNTIKPNRTNYNLSKANFEKAIKIMPVEDVSDVNQRIRGASYIYVILNDMRFQRKD